MAENEPGEQVRSKRLARCTFEGCWKTSERPFADGWADLGAWGPGVPDGMYCPQHAAALEAGLMRVASRRPSPALGGKFWPATSPFPFGFLSVWRQLFASFIIIDLTLSASAMARFARSVHYRLKEGVTPPQKPPDRRSQLTPALAKRKHEGASTLLVRAAPFKRRGLFVAERQCSRRSFLGGCRTPLAPLDRRGSRRKAVPADR